MSKKFDLIFENTSYDYIRHPKLNYWIDKTKEQNIVKSVVEIDRSRDGLTFRPAKIYLHCYNVQGIEVYNECDDWDIALNDGLLEAGLRAITMDNEAKRFGLILNNAFKDLDSQYGDLYSSGVFGDFLNESGIATDPAIKDQMNRIHYNAPDRSKYQYSICLNNIKSILNNLAKKLNNNLKYNRDEAETIILIAISNYLDERYSITNRKMLGW